MCFWVPPPWVVGQSTSRIQGKEVYATLYLQAPFVPVKTVLLAARRQVQLACLFINNTYSSPAYLASTARLPTLQVQLAVPIYIPLVFIFFFYYPFREAQFSWLCPSYPHFYYI